MPMVLACTSLGIVPASLTQNQIKSLTFTASSNGIIWSSFAWRINTGHLTFLMLEEKRPYFIRRIWKKYSTLPFVGVQNETSSNRRIDQKPLKPRQPLEHLKKKLAVSFSPRGKGEMPNWHIWSRNLGAQGVGKCLIALGYLLLGPPDPSIPLPYSNPLTLDNGWWVKTSVRLLNGDSNTKPRGHSPRTHNLFAADVDILKKIKTEPISFQIHPTSLHLRSAERMTPHEYWIWSRSLKCPFVDFDRVRNHARFCWMTCRVPVPWNKV